jgi:hypothetical protein
VAPPAAAPLTQPSDTVAIEVLLLLHVTFLFVALVGVMLGIKVSVMPTGRLIVALFKDTRETDTVVAVESPGCQASGEHPQKIAVNIKDNNTFFAILFFI